MFYIKVILCICFVIILVFSLYPHDQVDLMNNKFHPKVQGYRCMFHIYRSFHTPYYQANLLHWKAKRVML